MSIRFSIHATCDEQPDDPVVIDAHHIASDGSWFDHPIRSHALRPASSLSLLAHVALGFVLHKGKREALRLVVTHDDPHAQHGLELMLSAEPDDCPDVPPAVTSLAEAATDIEAVEVERLVILPGDGEAAVTLRHATHLRIREVSMSELDRG